MQSYLEVHQATVSCARDLICSENKLVGLLQRGVEELVHQKLGYGSLKEYCLKELNFSHERTYAVAAIVNASLRVPELSELVQEGKISISNARRIAKRITPENKELWLEKAATLSQHALEKEIVKVFPGAQVEERVRPIAENLSSLLVLINDRVEGKWNRLNELLFEKKGSAVEKMEVLEAGLDAALRVLDPVLKAERAAERRKRQLSARAENTASPRRCERWGEGNIPAHIVHEVTLRDRGQCTHLDPHGDRCTNRTFLHIHHIIPRSQGGTNDVDNLTTHCSTHHRFVHQNDIYVGPQTRAKTPGIRSFFPPDQKNKNSQEKAAWKTIPVNLLTLSKQSCNPKAEATNYAGKKSVTSARAGYL